jgi:hypothetical protein
MHSALNPLTTRYDANNLCATVTPFFGRLCSKEELEVGCAKDDGCGYNNKFIWTCTSDGGDCGVSTAGLCGTVGECCLL